MGLRLRTTGQNVSLQDTYDLDPDNDIIDLGTAIDEIIAKAPLNKDAIVVSSTTLRYYFSTTGSDENDGLSSSAPFRSNLLIENILKNIVKAPGVENLRVEFIFEAGLYEWSEFEIVPGVVFGTGSFRIPRDTVVDQIVFQGDRSDNTKILGGYGLDSSGFYALTTTPTKVTFRNIAIASTMFAGENVTLVSDTGFALDPWEEDVNNPGIYYQLNDSNDNLIAIGREGRADLGVLEFNTRFITSVSPTERIKIGRCIVFYEGSSGYLGRFEFRGSGEIQVNANEEFAWVVAEANTEVEIGNTGDILNSGKAKGRKYVAKNNSVISVRDNDLSKIPGDDAQASIAEPLAIVADSMEAIATLESQRGEKPLAPNNYWEVNTVAEGQGILNKYDWQNSTVEIIILQDITANKTIYGDFVTNARAVRVDSDGTSKINSATLTVVGFDYFFANDWQLINGGRIIAYNNSRVRLSEVRIFDNTVTGDAIYAYDCQRVSVNFDPIDNTTVNSFLRLSNIDFAEITLTTINNAAPVESFIKIESGVDSLLLDGNSQTITGKLLNFVEPELSKFINLKGLQTFVETIPSESPAIALYEPLKTVSAYRLDLFVDATGDDNNDGVSNPLASFTKAFEIAKTQYNLAGKALRITASSNLTLSERIVIDSTCGADFIEIYGGFNTITWDTPVGAGIEINYRGGATSTNFTQPKVVITRLNLDSLAPGNITLGYIDVENDAVCALNRVDFLGDIDGANIYCYDRGKVVQLGTTSHNNSCVANILLEYFSLFYSQEDIAINDSVVSRANIVAIDHSKFINLSPTPFSGNQNCTGKRFELASFGEILINQNADLNSTPGTIAGTFQAGCRYDNLIFSDATGTNANNIEGAIAEVAAKTKLPLSLGVLTIFIDNAGDDNNDGSSASPVATFAGADALAQKYDLAGKGLRYRLSSNYTTGETITIKSTFGADYLEIFGANRTITWNQSVTWGIDINDIGFISSSLTPRRPVVILNDINFDSTNPGNIAFGYVGAQNICKLVVADLDFVGDVDGVNISAYRNVEIVQLETCRFNNACQVGIELYLNCTWFTSEDTAVNNASFDDCFISCYQGSVFKTFAGTPFSGNGIASGKRFALVDNSTIIINKDGDLNAIPGTTPGTFEPGCRYDNLIFSDRTGTTANNIEDAIAELANQLDLGTYGELAYTDTTLNMVLSSQKYFDGCGYNTETVTTMTDSYLRRFNGAMLYPQTAIVFNKPIVITEAEISCEASPGAIVEIQYYDINGTNGQILATIPTNLEGDRFGFFENEKYLVPARKRLTFYVNGTIASPQLRFGYRKVLEDLNV